LDQANVTLGISTKAIWDIAFIMDCSHSGIGALLVLQVVARTTVCMA